MLSVTTRSSRDWFFFFFSSRRRHTRSLCDWSSDVCSSDLWHYGHATNCAPFFDGVTTWVYLYTQEGETWFTSNSAFQHGMLTQCAQGNWVAFFVINTSGTFNEM